MATPHQKQGEPSHLKMVFDGTTLFLKNLKCLKGKDEHFRAVSGNDHKEPIPDGLYWIETADIHRMKWTDDWTPRGFSKPTLVGYVISKQGIWGALPKALMLHMGAWGEYRISIKQTVDQEKQTGRNKMFIHGGDDPGSAGCIDLGDHISILVSFLQKEHPNGNYAIDLTVHKEVKP